MRREARTAGYIIAIIVPPTPIELPSLSIPLMSRTKWRREPWSMTLGGAQGSRPLVERPGDDEISGESGTMGAPRHVTSGHGAARRHRTTRSLAPVIGSAEWLTFSP